MGDSADSLMSGLANGIDMEGIQALSDVAVRDAANNEMRDLPNRTPTLFSMNGFTKTYCDADADHHDATGLDLFVFDCGSVNVESTTDDDNSGPSKAEKELRLLLCELLEQHPYLVGAQTTALGFSQTLDHKGAETLPARKSFRTRNEEVCFKEAHRYHFQQRAFDTAICDIQKMNLAELFGVIIKLIYAFPCSNKEKKRKYKKKAKAAPKLDLVPSHGSLSPAFAKRTADYTVSVPNGVEKMHVTPTTSDAGATITVEGVTTKSGTAAADKALEVGVNTIKTVVTAADGATMTYTVTVTRAAALPPNDEIPDKKLGGKAKTGSQARISKILVDKLDAIKEKLSDQIKKDINFDAMFEMLTIVNTLLTATFNTVENMITLWQELCRLVTCMCDKLPRSNKVRAYLTTFVADILPGDPYSVLKNIVQNHKAKLFLLHGTDTLPSADAQKKGEERKATMVDYCVGMMWNVLSRGDLEKVIKETCCLQWNAYVADPALHPNPTRPIGEGMLPPAPSAQELHAFLTTGCTKRKAFEEKGFDDVNYPYTNAKDYMDALFAFLPSEHPDEVATVFWTMVQFMASRAIGNGKQPSVIQKVVCIFALSWAADHFKKGCKSPIAIERLLKLLPSHDALRQVLASMCIEKIYELTGIEELKARAVKTPEAYTTNVVVQKHGDRYCACGLVLQKDGPLQIADFPVRSTFYCGKVKVCDAISKTKGVPTDFCPTHDGEVVTEDTSLRDLYVEQHSLVTAKNLEVAENKLKEHISNKTLTKEVSADLRKVLDSSPSFMGMETDADMISCPPKIVLKVGAYIESTKLPEKDVEQLRSLIEALLVLSDPERSSCSKNTLDTLVRMLSSAVERVVVESDDPSHLVYSQRADVRTELWDACFHSNPTNAYKVKGGPHQVQQTYYTYADYLHEMQKKLKKERPEEYAVELERQKELSKIHFLLNVNTGSAPKGRSRKRKQPDSDADDAQ